MYIIEMEISRTKQSVWEQKNQEARLLDIDHTTEKRMKGGYPFYPGALKYYEEQEFRLKIH